MIMITYGTHCYSYYNITILFWLEWKRTQQTLKKQTNKKKALDDVHVLKEVKEVILGCS